MSTDDGWRAACWRYALEFEGRHERMIIASRMVGVTRSLRSHCKATGRSLYNLWIQHLNGATEMWTFDESGPFSDRVLPSNQ
jgi:hypothetical protein